ncbi:mediator complex subunit MED6 [Sporobolomyces koalae]|uniref:mediator complex subunit MED6 n=1 Tax=Sporobolomyces koalae TaxID=500713 RepID=UPI00317AB223
MDSDLSHLQWRAPEYLLSLPTGALTTSEIALDYFTLSPFFDKHSTNNQLRMQLMFSRGGIEGVNEQEELRRFVGTEYVVAQQESQPPNLYIILKRNRTSPTATTVMSVYHILNANVYQAPTIYTVLNERILTTLHALEESVQQLVRFKPKWTPEQLYHWNIAPPPPSTTIKQSLEAQAEADLAAAQEGDDEPDRKRMKLDDNDTPNPDRTDDPTSDPTLTQERQGDEFNPLLFKALQGLARKMHHEEQAEQA